MAQTIEFINSKSLDSPLNLMVDINEPHTDAVLTFTVTAVTNLGKTIPNDQLLKSTTRSDSTYVITLNNIEARYFLAVHTNIPINATILLAKASLNYISPRHNYLFEEEGIYKVYSNYSNVMV
jgi:hypothetical protein